MATNGAVILCLETAQSVASVALSRDGNCWQEISYTTPNKTAELLPGMVGEIMTGAGITFADLQAIAVSAGPGSYTGLRIAAAAAKGYCYAAGLPLVAVSTLEAMAYGAKYRYELEADAYLPMIDARRMEVYAAIYTNQLQEISRHPGLILDAQFPALLDSDKHYCLLGSGAQKAAALIPPASAQIFDAFIPSAADLCQLACRQFEAGNFADPAYFEPDYAKPFYSTLKVKMD